MGEPVCRLLKCKGGALVITFVKVYFLRKIHRPVSRSLDPHYRISEQIFSEKENNNQFCLFVSFTAAKSS